MRSMTCLALTLVLAGFAQATEIQIVAQPETFVFIDPLQLDLPAPIPAPDGDIDGNPVLSLGTGESAVLPIYARLDTEYWLAIWFGVVTTGDVVAEFDATRVPFDPNETKPTHSPGWLLNATTGTFQASPFPVSRWHPDCIFVAQQGEIAKLLGLSADALAGSFVDVGLGATVGPDPQDPASYIITSKGEWWKIGELYVSGTAGNVYLTNEGFMQNTGEVGPTTVKLGFGATAMGIDETYIGQISSVPLVTVNGGAPLPPMAPLSGPGPLAETGGLSEPIAGDGLGGGAQQMTATIPTCPTTPLGDSERHFVYDSAGRVVREFIVEVGDQNKVLEDTRREYDELGRAWRVRELATPGSATVLDDETTFDNTKDRITETGFDQQGNVTSVRRKATSGDALTQHAYDFADRRTSTTDPESGLTEYDHDDRGNVTKMTDPVGNEARFDFDAAGRQTLERRYESTTLDLKVTRAFDSRDNLIQELAAESDDTALTLKQWEYDSLGRKSRQIWRADATASPASPVDLTADRVTDFTYDGDSTRVETQTSYAGSPAVARTTQYDYDAIGRLEMITDPELNTESRTYDEHLRLRTRTYTELLLAARSYTYDYDIFGRLKSEKADGPPEFTTCYAYDALDRRIEMVDAKDIQTLYEYTTFSEEAKLTENARGLEPRSVDKVYDQLGFLVMETIDDGDGVTESTIYDYDLVGRRELIDFCEPTSGSWVYGYDAGGRMNQRTDPRGQVTIYTHNWRGQVLTKTVDSTLQETFAYNPLGWMTLAQRDASNKVDYTHDDFGQIDTETQTVAGVAKLVDHGFNQLGERDALDYPLDTGIALTFGRDQRGQVVAIDNNLAALATYAYAGQFVTDRAVKTPSVTATWITQHIDYDVHRRQTDITNSSDIASVVTVLDDYSYTFDEVSNRETASRAGATQIADAIDYDYDELHRLTRADYGDASSEVFALDLLGNRDFFDDRDGSRTDYGENNCVNEYPTITPSANAPVYDLAGNLVTTEWGYQLTYDYEQRLVAVRDPGSVVLATYAYDANGRRTREDKAGQTTLFVYDASSVIAEYDGAGNLQRSYIHGANYVDEHLVLEEATGPAAGTYVYLTAALHSVTGLVDEAGTAVVRYTYDAYGLPRTITLAPGDVNGDGVSDDADWQLLAANLAGPDFTLGPLDIDGDSDADLADFAALQTAFAEAIVLPLNPYLFTGRRLDFDLRDETVASAAYPSGVPVFTLYHYRARAYDPWHGRFVQRDPLLYEDSYNAYLYALANPGLYQDPTGQLSYIETLGVSGITGALFGAIGSAITGGDVWKGAQVGAVGGLGGGLAFLSGAGIIATGIVGGASSGLADSFIDDPLIDSADDLMRIATDTIASGIVGGLTAGAVKGLATSLSKLFRGQATYVIGKMRDLTSLRRGEASLLPFLDDDLGSAAANWAQNSSVLRSIIRMGRPIRDASAHLDDSHPDVVHSFLRMERNLLRNQGWTFDRSTGYWYPPSGN